MKKAMLPNSSIRNNSRFALTAVATAMLSLSATQSFAQEAPNAELEEIVVTGIRSSLERASDIKRNGKGVVDAISAEDIGKFPDSNLAESLQRVTGVSIDRSNNEGNQITVRGFGPRFNLVTLNGRSMPTSNALFSRFLDRSFNFNELAAGSVSAVEVYKTGRADLPTGGIGSTVNVRTAKPFDYDGFKAVANVKASVDTTNVTGSDVTPDVSLILSNHFADKKFGVLASMSYSERDSRLETAFIEATQRSRDGAGREPGIISTQNTLPRDTVFLARNFMLETQDVERERVNAQFVLQWAPTDNVEVDLDYTLSRYDEYTLRNSTGFWFGFDGNRFGEAQADGVVNLRDNGNNIDLDAFGFVQDLVTDNDSIGINVDWAVNDHLSFNLDAHSSVSESQPGGETAEYVVNFNTPNVNLLALDFGDGDIPSPRFEADFDVFDTNLLRPDIAQQRGRQIKNEIDEIKLVGTYEFLGDSALKQVTFGGALHDFNYGVEETRDFFLLSGFDRSNVEFSAVDRGSQFSDFSGGGPGLFPRLYRYDARSVVEQARAQGFFSPPVETVERVEEETTSLFASADFETAIADMPLTVNLGVRYEETDVTGQTGAQPIINTRLINAAQIQLVRSPELGFETISGSYDFVLPSIDFKLDISDNFVARASYSETITRQPIGNLTPRTRFQPLRPSADGFGQFNVRQGNAGLEPALAESLDLSFEWYYKPGSYASVGLFSKDVTAFTAVRSERTTFPDANGNPLRNPALTPRPGCPGQECLSLPSDPEIIFNVSREFNTPDVGNVRGAEIALQHVFENGFGFIANYTYTDGDIEFDLTQFDGQVPAPLTGLSDSANIVAFFERGPIQARIAYNWRDEFLLSAGQEPTFTEDYGQVDLSASYDISDTLSVFFEGLNVTDETTRRHGRSSRYLNRASSSGPRYAIGIRGSF